MAAYDTTQAAGERRWVIFVVGILAIPIGLGAAFWAHNLGDELVLKTLVGVIGSLICGLILLEPFLGLCLMVSLVPLEELLSPLLLSFARGWLTITRVVGVVTFLSFVANGELRRGMVRFDRQSKWILAFVLWMGLSSLWASQRVSVLIIASTVIQLGLFWMLLRALVRTSEELAIVSVSFVLGTAFAVWGAVLAPRWDLAPRLIFETGNPNHLGRDIGLSLILLVYHAPSVRSWAKVGSVVTGAMLLLGLTLTQSRSSWLTASGCVALVLAGHKSLMPVAATGAMASLAILLFSMDVLSAHLGVTQAELEGRLESIVDRETAMTSRVGIWLAGIRLGMRNPVLGVGTGGFREGIGDLTAELGRIRGHRGSPAAHNSYIAVFAELGIVGLALLIAILYRWVRLVARHPRSPEKMLAWALLAFVLARMLFADEHLQKTTWLAFALTEIVLRPGIGAGEREKHDTPSFSLDSDG